MLILALVEDRPRHGYEIAKLIEQRSDGVLQFHVASLYPLLYRNEQRQTWKEFFAALDRVAGINPA